MGKIFETVTCKGCGARLTIRTLEWEGDPKAYSRNEKFNADVPCERCAETYSYRSDDIVLVEGAGS